MADFKIDPDLVRFTNKWRFAGECWQWTGGLTQAGYAIFYVRRHLSYGHRWAYERWNGPIPEGLEIDHLCRNRACVNPRHLEAVTRRENVRRGLGGVLKTHCKHGHEFTEENTRHYVTTTKGWRRKCRECERAHVLRQRGKADA